MDRLLVEYIARALCKPNGFEPDSPMVCDYGEGKIETRPRWHDFIADAEAAIEAFNSYKDTDNGN